MTFNPQPKHPVLRVPKLRELAGECETCAFCGAYAPKKIVLAHPNGLKYGKGMGLKAHDLGAYLCPECHSLLDGRTGALTRHERDCMFLEAFYASMLWAFTSGKVRWVA